MRSHIAALKIKVLTAAAMIVLFAGRASISAAETVPKPLDLGSPDISVLVAIPNIDTLFQHMDAISKAFNPQAQPGQIKAIVGFKLGDPALANFDLTKPVVFMVFKAPTAAGGEPPSALFIPAKAASPYDQVAQQMQMQAAFKDGVLIIAKTDEGLKLGQAQLAAYGKVADAKIGADIRIWASVTSLLETYGPQIKGAIDAMGPQMAAGLAAQPGNTMDPKALMKILNLEMKGLMEMASEIDSHQIDLTIQADALSVDTLTVAHAGTPLADLFTAPAPGVNTTLKVLTRSAPMQGALRINPAGYQKFVGRIIDSLQKDPDFKEFLTPEIMDFSKAAVQQVTGDMAMTMNFTMESGVKIQGAVGVADDKKYVELLDKVATLMGPGGLINKLYTDMGMKMQISYQKAVRQHAGVDVNKYKYELDMANLPAAQAEQMKKLVHDTEIAVANKMYLVASVPAELDAMIDKALAGEAAKPDVSLEAITDLGNGKQLYFDYDFMGMIKGILSTMPPNPATAMFAQIKSSQPIVGAGSYDAGRMFMQTKVPLAGFIEMGQMAIRMQQGGGGVGGGVQPPPPPDPKDEKF